MREAKKKDFGAIKEIEELSDLHERDWEGYLRTLDRSMQKEFKVFVCEVQKKIVGKVELVIGEERGEMKGYVQRLAIHPDHRRKGYAVELMEHVLNYSKRKGVRILDLHVVEANKPAVELYKRLGFYVRHHEAHLRKEIK